MPSTSLKIGPREITLTNQSKPLYPSGFTKGDVVDYYVRVAPFMLPHLKGRAVTLKRYPNGSTAPFFFEKNCNSSRPSWMKTVSIEGSTGTTNHCLINEAAALAWAGNLAALEIHVPMAAARNPNRPLAMVFDLDPGEGCDLATCASLGLRLREMLEHLGLQSFPKSSGKKGLHLYVPLNTAANFDQTKNCARAIASLFEKEHPTEVTTNMSKKVRANKVFVDWSQNDFHKTTVCVYSLRAADEPMASAPVSWKEVGVADKKGNAANLLFAAPQLLERLEKIGDLFAPLLTLKQKLPQGDLAGM
jgi:bifunctional non-homologous end joining protein LigD